MNPSGKIINYPISSKSRNFTLTFKEKGLYWIEIIAFRSQEPIVNQLYPIHVGISPNQGPGFQTKLDHIPPLYRKILKSYASKSIKGLSPLDPLELINLIRKTQQASPLIQLPRLTRIAHNHSKRLSDIKQIRHTIKGVKPLVERLRNNNFSFSQYGEVIAYGPTMIESIQNLIRSPAHLKTIVNPAYTDVGIAWHTFFSPINGEKLVITVMNFIQKD